MNIKNYTSAVPKILWSLAPLAWGAFSWFVWSANFIHTTPLKFLTLTTVASATIILFFGTTFNTASRYKARLFNYSIALPPWYIFLAVIPLAVGLCFTPLIRYDFLSSLTQGILIYSIFEEFIVRGFFTKYTMSMKEFIFYNTVSSLSFTFMHCFYGETPVNALSAGHFGFGFALGFIAYTSRRIELGMLLHILANIVNYTIPVIILKSAPALLPGISRVVLEFLFCLIVIGCAYSACSTKKTATSKR